MSASGSWRDSGARSELHPACWFQFWESGAKRGGCLGYYAVLMRAVRTAVRGLRRVSSAFAIFASWLIDGSGRIAEIEISAGPQEGRGYPGDNEGSTSAGQGSADLGANVGAAERGEPVSPEARQAVDVAIVHRAP